MSSENNKRIAKNTLFLYFRMLLTMGISLYTVRIVLDTLGIKDYGIYNIVGGFVSMFAFFRTSMSSATQRFLAFELGCKNYVKLKQTFSLILLIYAGIALLFFILAETIGLWFLNTQMTIPDERMNAANWVYQFSIFSFIVTILTVPYNAIIIARERMNIFAYISIFEVILKLIIVYLLIILPYDKLKIYSVLTLCVTIIITFLYKSYCKKKYEESKYIFYWNKIIFYQLVSFSGWSLFGSLSGVLKNQGINVLLNMFFGPVINAARGIAFQVNNTLVQFVSNFYTSVRPPVIKSYASENRGYTDTLVYYSSKYSYFLLLLLSVPVIIEAPIILNIWLKVLPDYAVIFTRLVIFDALINSISYPLMTLSEATGRIKWYQIIVGTTQMLNLPVAYWVLSVNYPPQAAFYTTIIISCICIIFRLVILKRTANMNIQKYVGNVIIPIAKVTLFSFVIPIIVLLEINESIFRLIANGLLSMLWTLLIIYTLGMFKAERFWVKRTFMKRIWKMEN